ncbi:MAG: AAA family ATPase [Nitrospinae bacterium]|nr:AAA family ATPase [Nitrospinota bacterium]
MLRSFEISNFRGFESLDFKNIERLNLIAGKNNAGKTALLESIWFASAGINPGLALTVNAFRGLENFALSPDPKAEQPWDTIFHGYDRNKEIFIKGTHEKEEEIKLKIKTEPLHAISADVEGKGNTSDALVFEFSDRDGSEPKIISLWFEGGQPKRTPLLPAPIPSIFLSARRPVGPAEDASRFGVLSVEKGEEILIESLKCIEPRLTKIAAIPKPVGTILHGDIGTNRLMPLPLMGEGIVRLTTILLAIASAPDGVVLIDEIENGLHHTVMPKVWEAIGKMSDRFYTQVFATTHSLECIQAAHQTFKGAVAYEFRVHRLDRNESVTTLKTYDQDTLDAAIEADLEVR